MKRLIINLFSTLLLISLISLCRTDNQNDVSKNNSWEVVSNSTNYLDFVRFIIENPKSEYFNQSIEKYFKLFESNIGNVGDWDCFSDCASVFIKPNGKISFEDEEIELDSLRYKSFQFLLNKSNDNKLPQKIIIRDNEGNERFISKGIFEISYIIDSCSNFQVVVENIVKGISDYKDFLSNDWYKIERSKLQPEDYNLINSFLDTRMIFWRYKEVPKVTLPTPLETKIE